MEVQPKDLNGNVRASAPFNGRKTNEKLNERYQKKKTMNKKSNTNILRVATWNIGSLTGRTTELVNIMKKRRIDIIGLQETKWKGQKARTLSDGYKLLYMGSNTKQNGVAIILNQHLAEKVISIDRKNDRLMVVKIAMGTGIWNLVSAYAPQAGCSSDEKDEFWRSIESLLESIPPNEKKIILADLNGHVGEKNDRNASIHGGFGYGSVNAQGNTILDFSIAHNLSIVNTFFTKSPRHLITYSSGHNNTQIDYIMCDLDLRKNFRDCKVILGEPLASQHRLLVGEIQLPEPVRKKDTSFFVPKIKWHILKDPKSSAFILDMQQYLEANKNELRSKTPNDSWNEFHKVCLEKASIALGKSKGKFKDGRETWWWNDTVQEAVLHKKVSFKSWKLAERDPTKTEEEIAQLKHDYKRAKKNAKIAVAVSKHKAADRFYEELETVEGQKAIYQISKTRQRKATDINNAKFIRDENGMLLTDDVAIKNRWLDYYKVLLNETFAHTTPLSENPVLGPIQEITTEEVQIALSKMKNGKATGPDEIPVEFWKKMGASGLEYLAHLFNQILNGHSLPDAFKQSFLLPFYKRKGDASLCTNYRGIKLLAHTLKILERILDKRIKQIANIHEHQCGFMEGRSTIDAIQTLRIIIEKSRENKENLHLAFIDLEKAFDRVPRDLVWEALRSHDIPEYIVLVIMELYAGSKTRIRTTVGLSEEFEVLVGVSQGSALSPLLFILVMNYVTSHLMNDTTWSLIFADDIVLVAKTAEELEEELEKWRNALESNGLRISRKKTEYMFIDFVNDETVGPQNTIRLASEPLNMIDSFTYLGSLVTNDGKCDKAVDHRIQAGWLKYRSVSGVICDKRMPIKLKGKIYNTIIKPVLMYASETWTRLQTHNQRLQTTENKMLRWSGGVTLLDHVPTKYLHGSFGINGDIRSKMDERQIRWYGHVLRRDEQHVTKKALQITEPRRGRGRPKETWWRNAKKRAEEVNLEEEMAPNRPLWNLRSRAATNNNDDN